MSASSEDYRIVFPQYRKGQVGLPVFEGTILDQVIARLSPQVAGMAINANGEAERFAALGLPVLPDSIADYPGPLAGVLAGLDWAAGQGAESILKVILFYLCVQELFLLLQLT